MAVASEAIAETIEALVDYAAARGLIDEIDRVWAYNAVLEATGSTGPGPREPWALGVEGPCGGEGDAFDLERALGALGDVAVRAEAAADTAGGRDRVAMRIMGALTPRPSETARRYRELEARSGPRAATDGFYRMCCDAGYVRRSAIARDIRWTSPTRWGDLEITINRSKPEKDPREIAAAGARACSDETYPACQLCIENEGYPGRAAGATGPAHPARQNLRIVPLTLGGERWGLQYSPYAYFREHCIAMSAVHRPMHIDRATLTCLLDFADAVPHYFIGSNADLPVVGGSILSHDHFQGGAHEFPMMRARATGAFSLPAFPAVEAAIIAWPLSVVRLRSSDRAQLLGAAGRILDAWRDWSDASVGIVARTAGGAAHNTVTPIVRRIDAATGAARPRYEAYLALRCNIASDEHPLGVFHPHAEYHHIKKENIGLIEVMGLAILPPRLIDELAAVERHLVAAGQGRPGDIAAALEADPLCAAHAAWAERVYAERPDISAGTVGQILRDEVGAVFGRVLENAGVFKWDAPGREAQQRFVDAL